MRIFTDKTNSIPNMSGGQKAAYDVKRVAASKTRGDLNYPAPCAGKYISPTGFRAQLTKHFR